MPFHKQWKHILKLGRQPPEELQQAQPVPNKNKAMGPAEKLKQRVKEYARRLAQTTTPQELNIQVDSGRIFLY